MFDYSVHLSLGVSADYFAPSTYKAGGWAQGVIFKTGFKGENEIIDFINDLINAKSITFSIPGEGAKWPGRKAQLIRLSKTRPAPESGDASAFLQIWYVISGKGHFITKLQLDPIEVISIPNSNFSMYTIIADKIYIR
ncbi:MAG: hypothetical protein AB1757_09055 [Acidobacteriota bacterium]